MKEVTIQIHHHESLETEEDCEEMQFFSASYHPEKRSTVYTFKKLQKSKEIFRINSQIGEIKLKHFCLLKVGRKRKGHFPEESGRKSK